MKARQHESSQINIFPFKNLHRIHKNAHYLQFFYTIVIKIKVDFYKLWYARVEKDNYNEVNTMNKLRFRIHLEFGVILLMALDLLQNLILYNYVDRQTFYYANILVFLGIVFGMMGTSLFVVIVSLMMIAIGSFTLYFFPIVMIDWLKIYFIFIVPAFTVLGYFIKTDIFLRKQVISSRKDMATYLKNTDALTQLGTLTKFNESYQRFVETIELRPKLDRCLAVSLFYIDYLDQYRYQSETKTNELIKILADDLETIRLPEEQLFYVGDGAFVVLTPLVGTENIDQLRELTQITKTQLSLIPFDGNQDITLRSGLIVLERDSQLTAEQVLSRLNRQAETDLSEEYIV